MRRTCKTLIDDAKRAGFEVKESERRTLINNGTLSLFVYQGGTIYRADMPLELCRRMRVTDAYSALRFELNQDA